MTTRTAQRPGHIFAIASAFMLLGALALVTIPPAQAGTTISWWMAGDSYSSGEGVRGSGVSGNAIERQCAQSELAYAPRAADILRTQRGISTTEAFTACTGAVTTQLYNNWGQLPTQALWARNLRLATGLDVMSFSFGGNDVDFGGIIFGCVKGGLTTSWSASAGVAVDCPITADQIRDRITDLAAGKVNADFGGPFGPRDSHLTMAQLYGHVANTHLKDGGVLIVAGYPRLIAPSSSWPAWRHGRCSAISAADADMLGVAAEELDAAQRKAVADAQRLLRGGRKIHFVSRLDLFDDSSKFHGVCSPTSEWVNGTWSILSATGGRLQNMFHPNRTGHQVTAEYVAGVVSDYVGSRSQSTPKASTKSPEPAAPTRAPTPVTDGTSHYGAGDPFSSYCSVAWPTAPSYTSTAIILTMTCDSSPEGILFTQVSYPDPALPITPSTGRVRVTGTVVDEATSAYGYRILRVAADSVDLNP